MRGGGGSGQVSPALQRAEVIPQPRGLAAGAFSGLLSELSLGPNATGAGVGVGGQVG